MVLVLDCAKSARSVAAVALGFESFDSDLPLAGLILNRVAGENHYRLLESAIEARCKTPILGWLPREPAIAIPERHLGLHAAAETESSLDAECLKRQIHTLASLAEKHFKVDALLRLDIAIPTAHPDRGAAGEPAPLRIGVARDRGFSFYYEDNLDLLREQGAEIVPFSPIADRALPAGLDALYFGGGYPELYAGSSAKIRRCWNRSVLSCGREAMSMRSAEACSICRNGLVPAMEVCIPCWGSCPWPWR